MTAATATSSNKEHGAVSTNNCPLDNHMPEQTNHSVPSLAKKDAVNEDKEEDIGALQLRETETFDGPLHAEANRSQNENTVEQTSDKNSRRELEHQITSSQTNSRRNVTALPEPSSKDNRDDFIQDSTIAAHFNPPQSSSPRSAEFDSFSCYDSGSTINQSSIESHHPAEAATSESSQRNSGISAGAMNKLHDVELEPATISSQEQENAISFEIDPGKCEPDPETFEHTPQDAVARHAWFRSLNKYLLCSAYAFFWVVLAGMLTSLAFIVIWSRRFNYGPNESSPLGGEVSSQVSAPTSAPTAAAEKYYSRIRAVTSDEVLRDESTGQYRAYQWLLNEDRLGLTGDESHFLQRYILASLYFATNGDVWKECGGRSSSSSSLRSGTFCGNDVYSSRFLSAVEECQWYGITCAKSTGEVVDLSENEVVEIILTDNNLRGTIPPEISNLPFLYILTLSDNSIKGTLPASPPRLRTLILDNNDFTGTLSPQFKNINNLRTISLANNKLWGTIPPDFFPGSIASLNLEGNKLSGSIPSTVFDLEELSDVNFGSNRLTGTIATEWGNLSQLAHLSLGNNLFNGTLPDEIFPADPPVLKNFSIGLNNIWGTIPEALYSATSLEHLDLSENRLTGTLSTRLGDLYNLRYLIIWQNEFEGTIPKETGNLASLAFFQAPYNYLTGEVPEELCALRPQPLATLGMDCQPALDGEAPTMICSCCTVCYLGYFNDDD
eukprot:CAMPEP_0172485098 /NCGR_PEP_ID=MMETSP1066-20121228/12910_1 /TAXON_ID=671091 /ORGANISM="Coscinodiscus wailesii, Strain CCMP2513" /LENGTH=723 /DNA_ID=CAMNT_0013250067 /DNA_START=40 /DNA_END=2211 /DNA_ORIENTATION=-